jgi:hypothetical protein
LENKRNIVQDRFSKEFILETVKIILDRNIFYFDGKFYRQKRGTAMGTKMVPTYATLVLGYLEHILYPVFVIVIILEAKLNGMFFLICFG